MLPPKLKPKCNDGNCYLLWQCWGRKRGGYDRDHNLDQFCQDNWWLLHSGHLLSPIDWLSPRRPTNFPFRTLNFWSFCASVIGFIGDEKERESQRCWALSGSSCCCTWSHVLCVPSTLLICSSNYLINLLFLFFFAF